MHAILALCRLIDSGSVPSHSRRRRRSLVRNAALMASFSAVVLMPAPASADTPALPTPACDGIHIVPGMNADTIQGLVDANPAGTKFCFSRGTYVLEHYVTLKDSNRFICTQRRACILTGLDKYRGALTGTYGTSGQLIQGFVVEHFISVPGAWPNAGVQVRDLGTIQDNEIHHNDNGIDVNANNTVYSNYIHHNRIYGLTGGPGDNIVMQFNELAYNNTTHQDPNYDAGGSKIVGTSTGGSSNVQWLNNYVHDNWGNGIWSDGNVRNAIYDGNRIENNGGAGIAHEISWDAVIRNNAFKNNDTFERGKDFSCWHGAQILLNNSQNVQISGNTVEGVGINPICLVNSTREEGAAFPQSLANVSVSSNVVRMSKAAYVGFVGDSEPSGISFTGNTYYVDNLNAADWTAMDTMTFKQWQAAGFDTTGQVLRW
jgi:parallel beta-helix repeat protein